MEFRDVGLFLTAGLLFMLLLPITLPIYLSHTMSTCRGPPIALPPRPSPAFLVPDEPRHPHHKGL